MTADPESLITEINNRFRHYAPRTNRTVSMHTNVRSILLATAGRVASLIPDNAPRERALFLTKIEEAMFWANAGVARGRAELEAKEAADGDNRAASDEEGDAPVA